MQSQNTQASFVRRGGIKATDGQLDRWESDQLALQQRRDHRAIVHRLCLQACDLYRSSHPLFCLGAAGEESIGDPTKEAPAASLTCPDYFALSSDYAVEDFKASSGATPSDIRQQQSNGLSIVQLCHSKSSPVNFSEFCDLIANRLEDISS
jgi:hypothetical protein